MFRDKNRVVGIISLVVITAIISFTISIAAFWGLGYFNPKYEIAFDRKDVNLDTIKKFTQTRNILKAHYYENVNDDVLLEGAIAGMTDSLKDPYTVYYTKEQMKVFTDIQKKTEDTYVGIGVPVTLDNNGVVTVLDPFDDSPARNAGIKQGDKIIKVDDKDVTAFKDEGMVVSMIKGKENTKVKITVYRPAEGKTIDFDIIRKKIKAVINIRSEILDNKIGYIKLKMFDEQIANNFEEHLKRLLDKGIKGLIIDVRDNPGGLYDEVVQIADRLLPEGVIVYTKDRAGKKVVQKSDNENLKMPLAILVNENSASASEILAGAVKDNKKGVLVGAKTFGKGLVQTTYQYSDGTGIKLTIARYFTPSDVCIQGIGIKPDIEVKLDEKYKEMPVSQMPREDDSQLNKALELIKEQI
ncbi:MAG: S41 family peptidase [Clostridia bacterium]|nr:S41 family peptidase [Clostridia bacterium]